jgi:hypothetical protein
MSARGIELLEDALASFRVLRVEIDIATVEAHLAEAALWLQRPEAALAQASDLLSRLPADASLEPIVRHVAGVALAQLGDRPSASAELQAAVAAARTAELPFELALSLDALDQTEPAGGTSLARGP